MGEAERIMQLFEQLPEEDRGELIQIAEFLAKKADPVAWALANAPTDDEALTPEEEASLAASEAEIAAGVEPIPMERIKAELGL